MLVFTRCLLTRLFATMFVCAMAGTVAAAEPDWSALANGETVEVVTADEDGDVRETTIWMVAIDGAPYIRTSKSTTWGDNVERNPDIALRIGEREYPLRARFIKDAEERARIVSIFEEKYGSNPILNWIRGDDPRIMRLDPRPAGAPVSGSGTIEEIER